MRDKVLFSAGDCPVCAAFGAVLFVKSPNSGTIFFCCPTCGLAWSKPPQPKVLDEMQPVSQFASDGFELPTREEVEKNQLSNLVKKELEFEDWYEIVKPFLSYDEKIARWTPKREP